MSNPDIYQARVILSNYKKEVNYSGHFGDSEVYYINNNNQIAIEGYLGRRCNKTDTSNITVDGVEYVGEDARKVIK